MEHARGQVQVFSVIYQSSHGTWIPFGNMRSFFLLHDFYTQWPAVGEWCKVGFNFGSLHLGRAKRQNAGVEAIGSRFSHEPSTIGKEIFAMTCLPPKGSELLAWVKTIAADMLGQGIAAHGVFCGFGMFQGFPGRDGYITGLGSFGHTCYVVSTKGISIKFCMIPIFPHSYLLWGYGANNAKRVHVRNITKTPMNLKDSLIRLMMPWRAGK
jgi:hypothetical protein